MKSSKTSLFLMELIIAILFFSISSAVCIQLFVKAHLLDLKTQEENLSLMTCQNFNELYLGTLQDCSNPDPELLKEEISSVLKSDISSKSAYLLSATGFPDEIEEPVTDALFSIPLFYNRDGKPASFHNCSTAVVFYYFGEDGQNNHHAASYAFHVTADGDRKQLNEIYHIDLMKHIPERIK